jgi:hypothetical protein
MIQLRQDCLWLKGEDGEIIPCSVEQITLEIIGGAAGGVDPEVLRHAAAGVLHYFREEIQRETVTVGEFAQALSRVLAGFGLALEVAEVKSEATGTKLGSTVLLPADPTPEAAAEAQPVEAVSVREIQVRSADLRELAAASGKLGELVFFPRLRDALLQGLIAQPEVVEFRNLRGAVKLLLGRKHWTNGCRELEARIVDTLRTWWSEERKQSALVVH